MTLDRNWSARVVRPRELTAAEIELWSSFCRTDPSLGHPFFSYAFVRAVERVYPYVFTAILEHRGRIVGFLPFQFSGRFSTMLRAAERVGGNLADRFGVIASEDLALQPAELLRLARLNSLSYAFLPAEQLRHGFPKERAAIGQRIFLDGEERSFWPQLKATSRKFTTQLERKERVLERELGPLKFAFRVESAAELPRLIRWKREQYKRTSRDDAFAARWKLDLFSEMLRNPDPQCTATLSTLYAGETWLASHLGIMSESVFHHWFPVHSLDWRRCSPGHILTKHLILSALRSGISYFDFGGYGQYKDFFRPESYEFQAGFWFTDSLGGMASRIVKSLAWRVEALERRSRARRSNVPLPANRPSVSVEEG